MIFVFNYPTPSVLEARRDGTLLGLSAERPVRFSGIVRHEIPLLRFALRAFGEVLWSWRGGDCWHDVDPVVTVHPDQITLEAFSADLSAYAQLALEPDLFEREGEVLPGTTCVDFNSWLWAALSELRSSRETRLTIDPAGFEVSTLKAGGRFAPEVELPDAFVRGLVELQAAQTLPGIRLVAAPVDLLAPIRYLRSIKARVSPRALRYEFDPGGPARIVLEPWEKSFTLHDTVHGYDQPRGVRTWGRDRLRLLESLLPFADRAQIFLKGRGLPTFYQLDLPRMRFTLGLTGWSSRSFLEPGFSLLQPPTQGDPSAVLAELRAARTLAEPVPELDLLVRQGLALYDMDRKQYRHRELFGVPIPVEPDVRLARVPLLPVTVEGCEPQETRKVRRFSTPDGRVEREVIYRDWRVRGQVDGRSVEAVVNNRGRTIFATCDCPFFSENLLSKGPCEHILALVSRSADLRVDGKSSLEARSGEAPGGEDDE